ncbi:hypothetical protein H310_00238 [Aphanomyces invadans]|uniref:Uncharacterized protein n=1 Tax=Aphanomyces invadans TaxID=157072 RepID=A0A024UVR7_9STRA|nr:hypothetical protein H310_00238 [Aphanomyces invadans]ETW09753.1 hypothetical protein H310_00238 [Aphanomyces invadans]|eukprot:XP_008861164.1 hypothetical protein H310_00238 [Aphanomyces invadans]
MEWVFTGSLECSSLDAAKALLDRYLALPAAERQGKGAGDIRKWCCNDPTWLVIGANTDNTCFVQALKKACAILDLPFTFTQGDMCAFKDKEDIALTSSIPLSKYHLFIRHLVLDHALPFRNESVTTNIAKRSANDVVYDMISAAADGGVYLVITSEKEVDILETFQREDNQRPHHLQRISRLIPTRPHYGGIRRPLRANLD